MAQARLAITGAKGFVGCALVKALAAERRHEMTLFGRSEGVLGAHRVLPNPTRPDDLEGVDCLIHLAAAVGNGHSEAELEQGNAGLSLQMARLAREAGVTRFIHLSSIGVHGNARPDAVSPHTPLAPHGPYTRAKARAEIAVREALTGSDVALVTMRAPMIFGRGGRGNFQRLVRLVDSGLPLPFRQAIRERSFISLPNTVSAIRHAASSGKTGVFLPAEASDISLSALTRAIAAERKRSVSLFSVPPALMAPALGALGQRDLANSLFGQLIIDRRHWADWGWRPELALASGIAEAVS